MRLEQSLSASDSRRVQDTIQRFGSQADKAATLSVLVDNWRGLVHSIATGEDWTLAEYNKGLRTRDLIEEINESLSMDGRRLLRSAIEDIDRDFIAATYDPMKRENGFSPQTDIGWWQYRIPKDPRGNLQLGIPELGMGVEPPSESCGELPIE